MSDPGECVEDGENGRLADVDADAQRWVAALTLTGLLMTVLLVAGLYAGVAARDANPACLRKAMNDGHALMAAFFQAPPEQDAVAEAMRACSRGPGR